MAGSGSTVTLADGAEASNPGMLRVNLLKYARSYPLWPAGLTVASVVVPLVALAIDVAAGITAAVFALIVYFLYWRRVQEHFWHGCVCPAVVVSDQPYQVAVWTDLTTGIGEYPVIKVLDQPLAEMTGGAPRPGKPLATVALYSGSLAGSHWDDFSPRVVNCVSANEAAIQRVLESIPDEEWLALKHGLAQVPRPLEPGLYPIKPM